MRKKYSAAENIEYCRLCGREIVRLTYTNGQPYYADVVHGQHGEKQVVTGSGNHYNLKPAHDCVGEAATAMKDAQKMIEGRESALAAARNTLEAHKALIGQPEPQDNPWLANLRKTMIESIPVLEKSLAEQTEQTATYVRYAAEAKAKWEKLSAGLTILPATTVQVGKNVKVVKGRKVPVGTVGRVFWMGDDKFTPGQIRVGLVTADGAKHYTAATNVEVSL